MSELPLQSVKKKYHGKTRVMPGNWLLDVMEKLCREENGGCKRDHRSDNWAPPELEFCSNIWAAGKGWLFDRSAKYWLLHLCTESYLWLSIGLVEVLLVGVFISIFVFYRVFVFVCVLLELCRCIVVKIGIRSWHSTRIVELVLYNVNDFL